MSNFPNQQNKIWPPSATEPGVAVSEPQLKEGDLFLDTSIGRYKQCDDPTHPATWSIVGPPPPATNFQLTGATNESESLIDTERVVGGFALNGASYSVITFRFIGRFDPATAGDLQVRLYDMGPIAGPAIVAVLRSTLSINFTDGGDVVVASTSLTASGAPGTNVDQIFNTSRLYELRVILDSAGVGDEAIVHWAGIEVS